MTTREETKRMIEVMQAYVDGKEIEYNAPWAWKIHKPHGCQLKNPTWDWNTQYRVVEPKPEEL